MDSDNKLSIEELEQWFSNCPEPKVPFKLNDWLTVLDFKEFVESHFIGLKAANSELTKQPLLLRLFEMKAYIEANLVG